MVQSHSYKVYVNLSEDDAHVLNVIAFHTGHALQLALTSEHRRGNEVKSLSAEAV